MASSSRNALERRTCELLGSEDDFRLRFGTATAAASVMLPLAPAVSPCAAMDFLDRLASANEQWQQRLAETRSTLSELRQQQAAGARGLGDAGAFGGGRRGGTKTQAPRVGMSVINPSSRKRKAAKGVVFEEEEDWGESRPALVCWAMQVGSGRSSRPSLLKHVLCIPCVRIWHIRLEYSSLNKTKPCRCNVKFNSIDLWVRT